MLRLINVLLSFTVFAGVMACCCPCARLPIFVPQPQPIQIPVPVPQPQPINPGDGQAGDGKKKKANDIDAMLQKYGVNPNRDPGGAIVEIDLGKKPINDADLKKLVTADKLKKLILYDTPITGTGLKDVAGLPDLEYLEIAKCEKLSPIGMRNLGAFKQIKELWAAESNLNDMGLNEIAKLTQLKVLQIAKTKVTEAAILNAAKQLNQLEDLIVDQSVSQKTMDSLKKTLPPGCVVRKL